MRVMEFTSSAPRHAQTTLARAALALAATYLLWMSALPAAAQVNAREPDPTVWLRQIYDAYQRAEKNPDMEPQPSYELVEQRASKLLASLFKKNAECEAKQEGVCALDWDFIIDGQDFQLSKVKVSDAIIAGNKATVTASFTNMGTACINIYSFVREDGEWKVDDIEIKHGSDAPLRLATHLSEYDYNQ